MKKIRRKGKAEGSVLFTVVTVMMVMVVFLMSTLVLTTSANRRSYYTFYENQAQYTAQGVLDAILNAANNPEDNSGETDKFYEWITHLPEGTVGDIQVDLNGSGIPLTRYTDPNARAVRATVQRITDNYIWDAESSTVCKQNGWRITVTASVGQGRNASEYTMASYIYENPVVNVDMGVSNLADWSVLNSLKVNSGGTVTPPSGSSNANKARAIMIGTAANKNSGNNLMCLGPQSYGLNRVPVGRTKYASSPVSEFTNNSETVGDGIFVGNFVCTNNISFIAQSMGEGVQFWGDFTARNMFEFRSEIKDFDAITEYRQLPYIYVDGNMTFEGATGQEIGQQLGQPVNLYCGSMSKAPEHMNGDIYMFDPERVTDYTQERESKLTTFVTNNIRKKNYDGAGYVGGDIISNNAELNITGKISEIGGDLIMTNPKGKLTIKPNNTHLVIKGAILCAGDLEIDCGSNWSVTAYGGIYADPIKTHFVGNVNGNAGSGEQACKNAAKSYNYIQHSTHMSDQGEVYDTYDNSDTVAHFESLGGRGAEGKDYADLVSKLLSGNLGVQDGETTYYTQANNSGYDFSMFPFCSRQDEIFTHYFRWDLAADDANTAATNCDNDMLCEESRACGHKWAVTAKANGTGTKYVPYTVPKSASANYQTLDPDIIMPIGTNCFIPMLETYGATPLAANLYFNDVDDFKGDVITGSAKKLDDLTTKDVQFLSYHAGGGTPERTTLNDVPTITESCEIDITKEGGEHTIFIDPTQSSSPLRIVLKGSCNKSLAVIVNNNCYYPVGESGTDYSAPQTYSDYSGKNNTPLFAGRDDVQIFFDKSIFVTQEFVIMTTGAYQQFTDKKYDIISNPIYPGELNSNGELVMNGAWTALYPNDSDAYKFELVPNIVIYGQKDVDYSATYYGQPAFGNGFIANAEIVMPDSGFASKAGGNNMESIQYREFTDSIPYDPYANNVNIPNSKRIISLGTLLVGESDSNNVSNLPICVYLGDLNRNASPSVTPPTVTFDSAEKNSTGKAASANRKDRFSKDHQGAR